MQRFTAIVLKRFAAVAALAAIASLPSHVLAQVPAPAIPSAPVAPPAAITFGHLLDANGKMLANVTVVTENGRIKSIGDKSAVPAGAQTIDMSRFTAIPGLIDAHTHLAGNAGAPSVGSIQTAPRRHPAID